jgi:hypothetical protein
VRSDISVKITYIMFTSCFSSVSLVINIQTIVWDQKIIPEYWFHVRFSWEIQKKWQNLKTLDHILAANARKKLFSCRKETMINIFGWKPVCYNWLHQHFDSNFQNLHWHHQWCICFYYFLLRFVQSWKQIFYAFDQNIKKS